MVAQYLEKTRDEFLEEEVRVQGQIKQLQNHFKEDTKMIQMLDETIDPNYALFTPRETNEYNKKKIDELKADQKLTEEKLMQLKCEAQDIASKILEINSVIKIAKQNENISSTDDDDKRFAVLEAQENERQRIARDLHDSTVQNLTSMVHKSELCMKLMDVDPIRCRLEISAMSKVLRDIIEETRNMIYDLRPMSFDDIGFDITIERFLDKLKANTTIQFTYVQNGDPYKMNNVVALTLFRVIQEACNNCVKYSQASKAVVQMEYLPDEIRLSIIDDGIGFQKESLPIDSREDNSGFGLSMMKERIFLLSGKLDIQADIDKGCKIFVSVPVKEKEI